MIDLVFLIHYKYCTSSLTQASAEFADLLASLKISKGNTQSPPPSAAAAEPTSHPEGPLSPQSFAMVNTTDSGYSCFCCIDIFSLIIGHEF